MAEAVAGSGSAGNVLPESPCNGTSQTKPGVWGQSNSGPGVFGHSIGLEPAVASGGPVSVSFPPSDGVLGQGLNGVHGKSDA